MLSADTNSFYSSSSSSSKANANTKAIKKPMKSKFRAFTVFKEFFTQLDAFTFLKSIKSTYKSAAVFSYEFDVKKPGLRRFLVVSSPKHFFEEYVDFKVKHYYEIIQEDCPCCCYFDLEYDPTLNENCDGDQMLSEFIPIVKAKLLTTFPGIKMEEIEVIDMKSSSPLKWSHHVLFKMKRALFRDNLEVGKFVKFLGDELDLALDYEEVGSKFKVLNKSGEQVFFFDTSVYSRNRQFRILGSSKINKPAFPLVLVDGGSIDKISYDTFAQSLVCSYSIDESPLLDTLPATTSISSSMNNSHHQTSSKTKATLITLSNPQSPYPQIEETIISYISNICPIPHPKIKSYLTYPSSISYTIDKNKYCHRIKRQHQSNSVYYLVDLELREFSQRCFDPDCKNFQGPKIKLDSELEEDEEVYFGDIQDEEFFLLGD